MNLFITYLWERPWFFVMWTFLVLFSVSLHEFVHARTALAMGDDTAAKQGHLTLNPLKQMGMFSIIMFLFVGICYGAVPVNPARLRGKYGDLIVSLAGPATNLALAAVSYILALAMLYTSSTDAAHFFMLGMFLNLALFTLNILPIPPLDGFAIIRTFVPKSVFDPEWMRGLMTGVFILVFMTFGTVSGWLQELCGWLVSVGVEILGIRGVK